MESKHVYCAIEIGDSDCILVSEEMLWTEEIFPKVRAASRARKETIRRILPIAFHAEDAEMIAAIEAMTEVWADLLCRADTSPARRLVVSQVYKTGDRFDETCPGGVGRMTSCLPPFHAARTRGAVAAVRPAHGTLWT
jgi:hypothetical protein